jgi:hypothetical protein
MIDITDINVKLTISLNYHTGLLEIWLNDVLMKTILLKYNNISIYDRLISISNIMFDRTWFTKKQLDYLETFIS